MEEAMGVAVEDMVEMGGVAEEMAEGVAGGMAEVEETAEVVNSLDPNVHLRMFASGLCHDPQTMSLGLIPRRTVFLMAGMHASPTVSPWRVAPSQWALHTP
jgi:hypothetical protein